MVLFNYLFFIIITYFGAKFLFGGKVIMMHPYNKNYKLLLEGPEAFWILTFSTGLLSLSAPAGLDLSAVRLLVLEMFCFLGLFVTRNKPYWSLPIILYTCYIIWLFIGLSYSPAPAYGVRVIMKYIYILFVMLFSSAVVRNEELFYKAALSARSIALLSLLLIIFPFIELSVFPGAIWYSTARAIHYVVICMFSLALFFYAGKKKINLVIALLFVFPCIYWVFRTSIMGTALALMTLFFFKYKLKSLPFIFGVFLLFILSIFFVPAVREKMFYAEGGKSVEDLRSGNISADDINSNGRFAMWDWAMQQFYENKELTGTGTGNLQQVFYETNHPFKPIKICHNDYVQILCDSGLIGLFLFLGSMLFLIIHSFFIFQQKKYPSSIRVCAITAGSSIAGVLLTLYTDNGINYSMATISYPCGFYGMMLGLLQGYKTKSKENGI